MPKEPSEKQRASEARIANEMATVVLKSQSDAVLSKIFSPVELKAIDRWISQQNDPAVDRHEAIRCLVEQALKAKK